MDLSIRGVAVGHAAPMMPFFLGYFHTLTSPIEDESVDQRTDADEEKEDPTQRICES